MTPSVPGAAVANPPLTTIAQPVVEKGRRAAEMVFRGGPKEVVRLDAERVVRDSTAPPRKAPWPADLKPALSPPQLRQRIVHGS